jgi:hypothetical protein
VDADTGLYYFNARWYDAELGRFVTEDPARDGSNWYEYCGNNPLKYTDQTGNEDVPFSWSQGKYDVFGKINKIDTGNKWYNNVFDNTAAGAAGIFNLVASAGNVVTNTLGMANEGIDFLNEKVPSWCTASGSLRGDIDAASFALGVMAPDIAALQQTSTIAAQLKNGVAAGKVSTPYGDAVQATTKAALNVRGQVQNGSKLYRIGTTGKSAAGEAQFWSLENPLSPGYASRYGLPAENITNANFIETATLKSGSSFITRPAPGIGTNFGGGIEVVVPSGGVDLQSFSTLPR